MTFERAARGLLLLCGLAMVTYHMVGSQVVLVGYTENQAIHLGFIFALLFLDSAARSGSAAGRLFNLLLMVLGVSAAAYVYFNVQHLEEVVGFPTKLDVVVGVAIVVLVVEATRRGWGIVLPIVAAIFVAYFLFGHMIPGPLNHRHFNFDFVVSYLSIGLSGIFGQFLAISADQVFLFVVFGSLLSVIKVNDLFFEIGKAAGRIFSGGPGQTAVISSSLVGTVTGAAVANVAITGAFTIPFMKKVGYKPEDAGAIEATASTGGQIMPPVMGASAFLMASFLGVPYATIMAAALIPAILYYWSVVLGVQFLSVKAGIEAPIERVDRALVMRRMPLFLIPLAVMITLLAMHFSPSVAAFWSILLAIALSMLQKDTRPTLSGLAACLAEGAVIGAQIGVSLAIVGLMAQTLITTGLGSKIAGLVELLSAGNLILALILTMVVSLILGCGVPTSAAYGLVAIVVVPALVKLGVAPLAAHFFAFYFAVISAVTPPVALASLAGAGIAGASYMRTSISAFKLAIAGFIIPFLVVFNPAVILEPENWVWAVGSAVAIPVGLTALTAAIYNCGLTPFTRTERLMAALTAVMMSGYAVFRHIDELPLEYPMLALGTVLALVLLRSQLASRRRRTTPAGQPASAAAR
ncbi:MAG: TRAP transporter fused permease subunit [Hyphomicrobiaceae bacterium]